MTAEGAMIIGSKLSRPPLPAGKGQEARGTIHRAHFCARSDLRQLGDTRSKLHICKIGTQNRAHLDFY